MLFLEKCLQTSLNYLYLAISNRYIDWFFWRALESGPGRTQKMSCNLRWYQIRALNLLQSKIDTESLNDLSRKTYFLFFRPSSTSSDGQQVCLSPSLNGKKNCEALKQHSGLNFPHGETEEGSNNFPKISIVTPNYNQGAFLEKCIQSVLAQNYSNLEHIIIDGGSTDNSLDVIKKYEDKITFWVSEKDDGQADAINKGLKHASGEIFNWLNSDDYLEPGALFKCMKSYKKNPSAVGWIGGCRRIDPGGKILNVICPNGLDRENIGQNWNGRQFYQPSCFLSTKRVKDVGGLNSKLYFSLDLDLWIRILEKGKFVGGKGVWSNAVIHDDAKTQKLREKMHLETIRLQIKHGFYKGAIRRYEKNFEKGHFRAPEPIMLEYQSKIENSLKIYKNLLEKAVTVTVISNRPPIYDTLPLSLRNFILLQTLLANKCKINYIYTSKSKCPERFGNGLREHLNVYHISLKKEIDKIIDESNAEYVWITAANNIRYTKLVTAISERLKAKTTNCKILVDAAGFYDEGYYENNESYKNHRNVMDDKECFESIKDLLELSDILIVSNPKEKKDIEKSIGRKVVIKIIPNTYHNLEVELPYSKRRNICLIGHGDADHTIDAMRDFLENIFLPIHRVNSGIKLHIMGNNLARLREDFRSLNIQVIDVRRNLQRHLLNYKLLVIPINNNHKWLDDRVGIAAGAGVPLVINSIASKGYPVKDGEECFIADCPMEFLDKCNHILRDSVAWHNFMVKAKLMVAQNYSPEVVSKKLASLFFGT